MDIIYGKSIDQPGEVASPARGQLNRENAFILPVPDRNNAREFGPTRQGPPSRPASACSFSTPRLNQSM